MAAGCGPNPCPAAFNAGDLSGVVAAVVAVSTEDRRGETRVAPPVAAPSLSPTPTLALFFLGDEDRAKPDPSPATAVAALGLTLKLWGEVRGEVKGGTLRVLALALALALAPPAVALAAVAVADLIEEAGLGLLLGLGVFLADVPFIAEEGGDRNADEEPAPADKGPGLAPRDPPRAPARASAVSRRLTSSWARLRSSRSMAMRSSALTIVMKRLRS